jgi:hypothetical protein
MFNAFSPQTNKHNNYYTYLLKCLIGKELVISFLDDHTIRLAIGGTKMSTWVYYIMATEEIVIG